MSLSGAIVMRRGHAALMVSWCHQASATLPVARGVCRYTLSERPVTGSVLQQQRHRCQQAATAAAGDAAAAAEALLAVSVL